MSFEVQNTAEMPHFDNTGENYSETGLDGEQQQERDRMKKQLEKGKCLFCESKITHMGVGTCEAHVGNKIPHYINISVLAAEAARDARNAEYDRKQNKQQSSVRELPIKKTEEGNENERKVA